MLEFGSDGDLYVGTGDGGGGGDPNQNGQNTNALLGKMLRIDVAHPANGNNYGIPADNPYANGGGAPEVFMIGLRNPWRWSFDRATGDMWIGDVGQNLIEELDVLPVGQQNGKNLGWSIFEATSCYNNNPACATTTNTFVPQFTHTHSNGWNAIIGGQVYRGTMYAKIAGCYFFSDNGAHGLVMASFTGGTLTTFDLAPPSNGWPQSPSSIHADAHGELYETTTDGSVYHLEAP
jgi:glucose/arabinose dehydrogenase